MTVLAIDPGCTDSAYVLFDGGNREILDFAKVENLELLARIEDGGAWFHKANRLVIEQIASYGMPVGAEVFETCVWTGRFWQAFQGRTERVKRLEVKMHLCHNSRAKDGNIRQALIDRFGPVGTKKEPGKLYGVSGDVWAALAVAVTFTDKQLHTQEVQNGI